MFLIRMIAAGGALALCAAQLNQVWVQKRDLPEARIFEIATSIGGKILAVTSGEDGKPGTQVFEYDAASDIWTKRNHANLIRHSFGAGVSGGKIFIWGGIAGGKLTATTEMYNPRTDTWITRAPMPEPRMFAKGAEVAGKLYAVGGIRPPGRNQVPSLYEYDPIQMYGRSGPPCRRSAMPIASPPSTAEYT
jgi:hypothetical protein